MEFCKSCLMPDTRPGAIFDEEGICLACKNYDKRITTDWAKREDHLRDLCDKYRRSDGYYDCIIPVSGGKDSHFLVYVMKEKMNMNPLLVTVGDPFTTTTAGEHNYNNLSKTFNCDQIKFNISIDLFKRVTRMAFEKFGDPLQFLEAAIYTMPFKIAIKFDISFVIFGENGRYEYGSTDTESYSAIDQIKRKFASANTDIWLDNGLNHKEINSVVPPENKELEDLNPEVIFMSYFYPWSSVDHVAIAKQYGFRDLSHEWNREGCIEHFEQIDSVAYMVHLWLKYPKFGFQRTSDIASRRVREGRMSLKEAQQLIEERDHKLDQRALTDFIDLLGYSQKEFWDIVDKFWNKNIFEKEYDTWKMKESIREKRNSIITS